MNLRAIGLGIMLVLFSVFAAMAQDADTGTPDMVEAGRAVFRSHGCIACHGLTGEGSTLAPPLAGTSEMVIRRQIRALLGIMPNFPPESISAEELDALVAYLLTIEPFDATFFEGERLQTEVGEEIVMRHLMALVALEVGDIETAREHITHVMQYVESTHLQNMEMILTLLDAGEVHEAQHILETMVADVSEFDGSEATLHLRLLLSAIHAEDFEEANHQLEHYLESDDADEALGATLDELLNGAQYTAIEQLLADMFAKMSLEMTHDQNMTDDTREHETEADHEHDNDDDQQHEHD